jgi:hypothetical protein
MMHDYAARDFVDSGVLAQLAREFRLTFISSARLTIDLSPFGPVVAQHRMTGFRLRLYWLAAGLWHMAVKRRFELNRRNALRQASFGISPYAERIIDWGARLGLSRIAGLAFRAILRWTAPRLIPPEPAPFAVLAYTSVRSFFIDDVVRDARRRGIPLLGLVNNWDNLNTKSFLEVPPYLGVWGEQGFLIARLMYLIPAHRIFVIGAPRFEVYRGHVPATRDARAELGLPQDASVILFCGAGVSFEEVSLLDELEEAIEHGVLPRDLVVLYKPHPLRFQRVAEKPFEEAAYRHVRLVARGTRKLTELQFYPALLAAADALISPFSSMVIEGARFGLPALCLGYNDPGHANHDWNRAAFNLHSYVVRHGDWGVICERREDFGRSCQQLVSLIGDPVVGACARAAGEMVWRTGHTGVAGRLSAALRGIAEGRHADNSLDSSSIEGRAHVPLRDAARDLMAVSKD